MACDTRERGHGRTERRTLKVTSVARDLAFPHAAQAIQIFRRRTVKGKPSTETCYAVTSLTDTQASHAQLAAIIRHHWGIEDRLHWAGDMDFGEDRSRSAPPAAPTSWPACPTWSSPSCGSPVFASIAAALRYHARRPSRPLQTIMKC